MNLLSLLFLSLPSGLENFCCFFYQELLFVIWRYFVFSCVVSCFLCLLFSVYWEGGFVFVLSFSFSPLSLGVLSLTFGISFGLGVLFCDFPVLWQALGAVFLVFLYILGGSMKCLIS